MVRVFVLGATGFIGNPTALALRRHGHIVYGLARTAEKATELSKQEIIPVIGDAVKPETWLSVIENVDIVIDSSSSGGGMSETVFNALKSHPRVTGRRVSQPKLGFIYISGLWVHGHGEDDELVSDLIPVGTHEKRKPAPLVAWRPEFEESLLEARGQIDVIISRPGILFGGSGSLFNIWWGPLAAAVKAQKTNEPVSIVGRPTTQLALIHKDDLAEALLKTVEKFDILSQLTYPVFDINAATETVGDVNKAVAKVLGVTGEIQYVAPSNPFEEALSTSLVEENSRTRILLDWEPKHLSLKFHAKIYAQAWLSGISG